MTTRHAIIESKAGLHARPAAVFAEAAAHQPMTVQIARAESPENTFMASSILGLMSLDARYGDQVILSAEGAGAERALEQLSRLLETEQEG